MLRQLPVFLLTTILILASCAFGGEPIPGTYIGWKPRSDLTPDEPGDAWFRVHKLTLKGKGVEIEASPRVIKDGKALASASDGGFLTYKGEIYQRDGTLRVKMRVIKSDYVPEPVGGWPALDLELKNQTEVSFSLDGVAYNLMDD